MLISQSEFGVEDTPINTPTKPTDVLPGAYVRKFPSVFAAAIKEIQKRRLAPAGQTLKWSCFLGLVCGLAKMHLVLFMPHLVSLPGRSMRCSAFAYQGRCEAALSCRSQSSYR